MDEFTAFFETIKPQYLYAAAGFLAGALLVTLRLLVVSGHRATLQAQLTARDEAQKHVQAHMNDRFKVSAQEALKTAHESFLSMAAENFKKARADGAHDLDTRKKAIDDMVKPVADNLKAMNMALQQVKGTDQALRHDLQTLNRETARLVGALRDPAAQGQWGEFILEGVLDKSGLIKGVHYDTQVNIVNDGTRRRPDAVINMQDGFKIIIDAKAPVNKFSQRLSDDLSESEYTEIMGGLARQVREHVKALSRKGYWESLDSPDFTVLFLPSEHLYSMTLRSDPALVDFAAANNVIIASPTLLMSLVRVVSMSWRQVELAQNAQEISARGMELYKRLLAFTGHIEKVGRNLKSAMDGYNSAVGSFQGSVLPAARKFKDLQTSTGGEKELGNPAFLEGEARPITLVQEDEEERLKDCA